MGVVTAFVNIITIVAIVANVDIVVEGLAMTVVEWHAPDEEAQL